MIHCVVPDRLPVAGQRQRAMGHVRDLSAEHGHAHGDVDCAHRLAIGRIGASHAGCGHSDGAAEPGRRSAGHRDGHVPVHGADPIEQFGGNSEQRNSLRSLGLHHIGDVVIKQDRPEIRGMIKAVRHLVTVEEVE